MSEFSLEAALEVAQSTVGTVLGDSVFAKLRQELADLREGVETLDKLYAGGVDNWSGYSYALEND